MQWFVACIAQNAKIIYYRLLTLRSNAYSNFPNKGAKLNMVMTDAGSDGGEENEVVNLTMAITFQSTFNYFPGFVVPWQAAIRAIGMWREHVLLLLSLQKVLLS